ncbi:MAG: sensor histidine kinase [Coriobacteriia bacterium]
MPSAGRGSIRLWQTGLFIIVIVVAILILSGSLSAGLKVTLTRMAETSEVRNASSLARRLENELPLTVRGTGPLREVVEEYRDVYGGGIWVYDRDGNLLESTYDNAPVDALLEAARLGAAGEDASFASSDLRPNGLVVAGKPLHGPDGEVLGTVVTASPADSAVAILQAVRDRLWVTFWISLVVAGLLGFGFAELIRRRMKVMSDAAAAIAAGDFEQRLPVAFVPGEIMDLAESYNSMAEELGVAFAEARESRRQIAAVVESMAEGLLALDSAGLVRVINPEAVRLLSLPADDLTGRPVREFVDDPEVLAGVDSALAGEPASGTVALGQFIVLFNCTPLSNAGEMIEGAVVLLADVTEQHRIEDAQRRFVADASHEMRTPVAALKGMLELLADGAKEVPEVRDDFINTMQGEADRLGRLVADLLTLAQLEAGSLRLKLERAYAADLLVDVARVMQNLAEHVDVRLVVDAQDSDARVEVDRDRLIQVLLSFTDNALKHSPPGAVIHLRARRLDDMMRFEVRDQGAGMTAEQIDNVFERFYRADTARVGGVGTGLGLAIAKEIVEAHGSRIIVESAPGHGASFAFDLPMSQTKS